MPGIDLYAIYNLDRTRPPQVLAAQLTDALNRTDPRDTVLRNRIETARVVLGDPQRRAHYDAQFGDPSAPPITERTLAEIAGRSAHPAPRTGLAAAFASTQARVLAGVAIVLVFVLVVVVAVLASGGDDNSSTAAGGGTPSASEKPSRSSASSSPRAQDEDCTPLDATAAAEYVRDFRYTLNGPSTKSIGLFVEQAIALPAEFTGLNQVANPGDVDNGDGGLRAQALVQLADGEHVAVRYDTSTKTGPGNPEPNGVGGEEVSVQVSADGTVGTTSRTPLAGTAHTVLPTWTGANAVKSSTGYVTMLNSLPGMADFNGRDISFDRPVQILSMVPGPDSAEVFFLPDLIGTDGVVRPQLAPTLYRGRLYDYTAARKTAARNSGGYSITQQAARTACGL